jgi:hypothetical protein
MGFLPEGYKTPKTESAYLKPIEGTIKFRTVGQPIMGYEYWTENKKPVRLKEMPKEKPDDIKIEKDGSYKIKHFWAFKVIDRNDLKGVIRILELTQSSIMQDIENLVNSEDWNDPEQYDISITGEGSGIERRYNVMPSPHKPLSKEEKDLVKNTPINLEALFYGENPFDKNWESPAPVLDVTGDSDSLDDVPFN